MDKQWKLLEPVRVGTRLFKNRMIMAPMETRLSNPDGSSTREMAAYYAARAKGGVAAIVVENTFVDSKASRSSLVSSGLHNDHMIASKYLVAEAIKENGAVAILQLSHGGRQANAGATGLPAVAPSAVACKVVQREPHPLTLEEIHEIEDAFVAAALRAKRAGFDGVEIHGAHGYLISSFLSPYTNKRTDEYGGSLENRGRFPRVIARRIREAVGPDYIVGYRISGAEFVDGGLTIEEACAFARTIEDTVDYIHVSAGNYETMAAWMIPPFYIPPAPIVDLAARMKQAVRIPVITVGALDAELGEQALAEGKADLVAYGRALIADPELPNKIATGRVDEIRPCCRGNEGCISLFFAGAPIRCEVNPLCGRETEIRLEKVEQPRNVVIAGGGIAGLEAARVATEIGHRVTLLEQSDRLGGHYIEGSEPDFKRESRRLLDWEIRAVGKSGARVLTNTPATPAAIASYHPDVLIVAVGSDYARPSIAGIDKAVLPDAALMQPERVGRRVIVVGGGMVGSETALSLAGKGKQVTIVEMLPDICQEDEPLSQVAVKAKLAERGVKIVTNCRVTEVLDDGVRATDAGGNSLHLSADTTVVALGLQARHAPELENLAAQTFHIGDCVDARKIFNGFHEAWHAVMSIRSAA